MPLGSDGLTDVISFVVGTLRKLAINNIYFEMLYRTLTRRKNFKMAFLTMETVKSQLSILHYVGWQNAHLKSQQTTVGAFPCSTFITGASSLKLKPPPLC